MKLKEKLIKNAIFLAATTLVLVVVTVAWFISGSLGANTDQIEAEVFTEGYGYSLLEAEDTNMNGLLDTAEAENWVAVPGVNIDISNIVPNQYHFYKAVIQPGAKTTLQFKFTNIEVTITDPEATLEDFLSLIHIRFRTEDDADPANPMPGGASINESMFTILGDPAVANVVIYDLDLAGYTGTSFTIYYDIGVYPTSTPGDESQGASVSIGAIQLAAN